MEDSRTERAKVCTKCGRIDYPVLSPAVITAVSKGDKLLLAHNVRFTDGRYSIIAGFVESGESAEDAIVSTLKNEKRTFERYAPLSFPFDREKKIEKRNPPRKG